MNIAKLIAQLERKGYNVSFFEQGKDAVEYLDGKLDNLTIGFGDSNTLLSLNLYEILSNHNKVHDPQHDKNAEGFMKIAQKSLLTDVFITSVNAISETGELINIDGTGNRIAGSIFNHEKVYFIIGVNKIAPNLEEAIWRARNIAAPQNAKRLGLKTPCSKEGKKCFDCCSPERICNGLIIHFSKMNDIEMEVIIINEILGL